MIKSSQALLDGAFDHSGALERPPISGLIQEAWAFEFYTPPRPSPTDLPEGRGRPVLVIPAFLTDDSFTTGLRSFLDQCGFRSFGWKLGINWGPTHRILEGVRAKVDDIHRQTGLPISLIGISLGGLIARDLAYDRSADIAHVATVACPIRLPTATRLEPMIRLFASAYSADLNLARLKTPLPVPWTSVYSRKDGLIAWESCYSNEDKGVSIEVDAPHIAMARNPRALEAIVQRLARAP